MGDDHFSDPRFKIMETISVAKQSNVFKALLVDSQMCVAVKQVINDQIDSNDVQMRFNMETDIQNQFDNPFIVPIYEKKTVGNSTVFIMEYLPAKSLADYILAYKIDENEVKIKFLEILAALEYIHKEHKIVHRDIKLDNILLDKNHHIRLGDFGFSKLVESEHHNSTLCGTVYYLPPELIAKEDYSFYSDIWSLGVTLYAMVTQELPFHNLNMPALFKQIQFSDFNDPPQASPELKDLIRKMLAKDPQKRITIDQIRSHSWIQQNPLNTFLWDDYKLRLHQCDGLEDKIRKRNELTEIINEKINKILEPSVPSKNIKAQQRKSEPISNLQNRSPITKFPPGQRVNKQSSINKNFPQIQINKNHH